MQTLTEHYNQMTVSLADRYRRGELCFEEADLIYSAMARCSCGAGLARVHKRDETLRFTTLAFWHCSRCLTKGFNADGLPHDEIKEIHRWEIASEGPAPVTGLTDALSPVYQTTRPDAKIKVYWVGSISSPSAFMGEDAAKDAVFAFAKECGFASLTIEYLVYNATKKE